jgi:hypothetical protein
MTHPDLYLTAADLEAMLVRSVAAETGTGCRHVTVEHGDVETEEEAGRLEQLRRLALASGALIATRGGNDYTTWIFRGPAAPAAQRQVLADVERLASTWWRWSTEPLPRWGL